MSPPITSIYKLGFRIGQEMQEDDIYRNTKKDTFSIGSSMNKVRNVNLIKAKKRRKMAKDNREVEIARYKELFRVFI